MKNPHAKPGVLQRHDIGNIIAKKLNVRQREGQLIAREITRALRNLVAQHHYLELRGFAVFYTMVYSSRCCNLPDRQPKNHIRIRFRPGRRLKRVLAQRLENNARGVLRSLPTKDETAKISVDRIGNGER